MIPKSNNEVEYLSKDLEELLNTKHDKIATKIVLKNGYEFTADVARKESFLDISQLVIKCHIDTISYIEQFDIDQLNVMFKGDVIKTHKSNDTDFSFSWKNLGSNLYNLEIFIYKRGKHNELWKIYKRYREKRRSC